MTSNYFNTPKTLHAQTASFLVLLLGNSIGSNKVLIFKSAAKQGTYPKRNDMQSINVTNLNIFRDGILIRMPLLGLSPDPQKLTGLETWSFSMFLNSMEPWSFTVKGTRSFPHLSFSSQNKFLQFPGIG